MNSVLAYIGQLCAVEKSARKSGDDLRLLRQKVARPVATKIGRRSRATWKTATCPSIIRGRSVRCNRTVRSLRGIAVGRHYVQTEVMYRV